VVEKVSIEQEAYDNALDNIPSLPLHKTVLAAAAASIPPFPLDGGVSLKRNLDEMQVDQSAAMQRPHLVEVRLCPSGLIRHQGNRVSAMSPFRTSNATNRPPSRYLQRPPSSSGRVDTNLSSRSMLRARSALSSTPRPSSETPYGITVRKKLRWGLSFFKSFLI
jgi:hypothetical protein